MTGKSIVMSGPSQLRFGSAMAQDVIESLHATNVVAAREMIAGWRGNSSTISAGVICDIDGTGIKASRLALSGKMGVGPRISMKTLWGVDDPQLRLQLTFTKDASIFIFPSEGAGSSRALMIVKEIERGLSLSTWTKNFNVDFLWQREEYPGGYRKESPGQRGQRMSTLTLFETLSEITRVCNVLLLAKEGQR